MKIHLIHSRKIEYEKIYKNVMNSKILNSNEIYLPHETSEIKNTKELIKNSDYIIAEVTYLTEGLAIELGWADAFNKKIIFIYQKGIELNKYLKFLSGEYIEYEDIENLINKLENRIKI